MEPEQGNDLLASEIAEGSPLRLCSLTSPAFPCILRSQEEHSSVPTL